MCILTRSPPEAVHLGISRFRKNTQTAPTYICEKTSGHGKLIK